MNGSLKLNKVPLSIKANMCKKEASKKCSGTLNKVFAFPRLFLASVAFE